MSQYAIHNSLVIVVLNRAPIVDGAVDQVYNFLDASLLCEICKEAVVESLEDPISAFAETWHLGPNKHHTNWEDDLLHMLSCLQKASYDQCAEVLILVRAFAIH